MNSRLRASLTVGAVIRTISQPTAARSIVCWMLASVSIVSQVIIDWTRMGCRRPCRRLPTITARVRRRMGPGRNGGQAGNDGWESWRQGHEEA